MMDPKASADASNWLTLSDVAEILGVHPSTVRSWSDQGLLPVHRTQGRHRRYLRRELELWMQTQRPNSIDEAHLVVQNAVKNTRFQISEGRLNQEVWYNKLDEDARQQYRLSGRTLMQGLTEYMSSDGKLAQAEAHAIGYEYASRGRRYGLGIADACNAFLFFRNLLFESMLTMYQAAAVQSPQAWSEMFRKINGFTDQILVALLETYEAYNRGNR